MLSGARPYTNQHAIKDSPDYRTVEYIIERSEYVPRYERLRATEAEIGEIGFVVPALGRIPFLQLLIDYFDTPSLFFALRDSPQAIRRLMTALDRQVIEMLRHLADLDLLYVEFLDNVDGVMTHPKLFTEYCLPHYQRYTEILHEQNKKVGSHTDGNIGPLLTLLAESGLDVCESFSPVPLTPCTFEQAWNVWQHGPIIWGGIPSPLLEERTGESEFEDHVRGLLRTVRDRPIILGVGDMVLPNNSIERVRRIAEMVEEHVV